MPPVGVVKVKGVGLELDDAVDFLVNAGIDASPYADILLRYAKELRGSREVEMVARCMTQSWGFKPAVPWLLSLFERSPDNGLDEHSLWAAGRAIYRINDKKSYASVLPFCRRRDLGHSRQALIGILPRMRTDEAHGVLLQCLDDTTIRAPEIEALGRFGRTEAIKVLERLSVEENLEESKAKRTALRRLKRRLER